MGNLSYRGYLGITARNQDRNIKGVEVSIAKVMNMDPNYYSAQFEADAKKAEGVTSGSAEKTPAPDPVAEEVNPDKRTKDHMYTDEMENEHDLIEEFEMEQEDLEEYLENNPGNIDEDDTIAEVLYKMNEHMMHIIEPLTEFVANEDSMMHYIREHDHLPYIMKSFENLPKAIEDEANFVNTIDY